MRSVETLAAGQVQLSPAALELWKALCREERREAAERALARIEKAKANPWR